VAVARMISLRAMWNRQRPF